MTGPAGARLEAVARRLDTVSVSVVQAAADAIAQEVQQSARSAGRGRFYGRIMIGVETDGDDRVVRPTAGAGPMTILESGAKPHQIGRRGQLLTFGRDNVARGPVRHPGLAGKRAWTAGIDRGVPKAKQIAAAAFGKVVNGG